MGACQELPGRDKAVHPKERFTNATGDMKLTMYLRRPTCVYVDLSKPLSHAPASVRPRSALATGGCIGVPCQ